MKKIIIIILVIFLIAGTVLVIKNQKIGQKVSESALFVPKIEEKTVKIPKTLKIGEITLNIEVADTDAKREQGLSGKVGLAENEGMLFVFDKEGYYGFWMKDMNFPIDIVWLDKDKKIIHIENAVSPNTYPKVFNSPIPNLYVLEISSGFLAENNIKIGDLVAF